MHVIARPLLFPGPGGDQEAAQDHHREELHGRRQRLCHLRVEPRDGRAAVLRRGRLRGLQGRGELESLHEEDRARGVLRTRRPRLRPQARQLGLRLQPQRVKLVLQEGEDYVWFRILSELSLFSKIHSVND